MLSARHGLLDPHKMDPINTDIRKWRLKKVSEYPVSSWKLVAAEKLYISQTKLQSDIGAKHVTHKQVSLA